MPANHTIELSNPYYLPVIKDSRTHYGGSQMWFAKKSRFSEDYILRTYGCGTIATADILLYLAIQNEALRTELTNAVLQNRIDSLQQSITNKNTVDYESYDPYVRKINREYTHTRHIIAVLGPKVARAINSYSHKYNLGLKATWKWKLTYYDMLEIMEEMLSKDIPVIISIGPNWPNLWGKKGVAFYERREIDYYTPDDRQTAKNKPYYYHTMEQAVNGHYVVVTGIIKDEITSRIMLRISSWGKMYYINYEEYRDYIDTASSTWLSSLVQIIRND